MLALVVVPDDIKGECATENAESTYIGSFAKTQVKYVIIDFFSQPCCLSLGTHTLSFVFYL